MPKLKPKEYHHQRIIGAQPDILSRMILGDTFSDGRPKIHAQCLECDHQWTPYTDNLKAGSGCPECNGSTKSREYHHRKIIEAQPDILNRMILGETFCRDGRSRIHAQCLECGRQWTPQMGHLKQGKGCPECYKANPSKGHLLVREALEILGFIKNKTFFEEYTFDTCRNVQPLPFDFYIPEHNCLIEYQGKQHYKPIEFFGGEKNLRRKQKNDAIKKQWAEDNDYLLLRIPYKVDRLDLIVDGLIKRLKL